MTTPRPDLDALDALHAKATPPPWGWTTHGEKCNCAELGTFYAFDDACTPLSGMVGCERYNEKSGEYVRVADIDESIASKDDNARYVDFDFIASLRNAYPAISAELRAARAVVEAAKAVRKTLRDCPFGFGGETSKALLDLLDAAMQDDAARGGEKS